MLKHNLGQALRSFTRNPGFTVAVLLALAVGIGFVTALFSIANGVLLSRLPYQEPERLVTVFASFAKDSAERSDASYPDIVDWRKQSRSFEGMAAVVIYPSLNLMGNDGAQRIRVSLVSPSYFDLLGVKAALGRTFLPEEEEKPGGHPVVILSHGLWQTRFGGDPQVVGKPIRLNGQEYTVVGVMPQSFHDLSDEIEAWLPVMMVPTTLNPAYLENRSARMMVALARLKPGVSLEQAQSEMDTIGQRLAKEYADTNEGYGVKIYPLSDYVFEFSDIRRSVVLLLLGSAFVLLISCVNVASLFLVRAMNRQREIGLRLAIGADRRHLIGQLLTESLLLSVVGGLLGILLAYWAVRALVGFGSIDLPAFINLGLDGRALGLALLLSILTGLVFGMVPAFKSSRVSVSEPLRDARQLGGGDAGIGRGALIVSEVALAVMLLVAAGLMLRSFWLLHATPMGFDTERMLTLRIDLPMPKYTGSVMRPFARDLIAEARTLPGVEEAGVWGPGLPGQSDWYLEVTPEDNPAQTPEDNVRVFRHHVSPEALATVGIPLIKGRYLLPQDTNETPRVALISQSMGEALWPGQDPLGKRFLTGPAPPAPVLEVVGVVPDVKHRGRLLDNDIPRDFYVPYFQLPVRDLVLYLRTGSDPSSLAAPVRKMVQKLDPDLAVYDMSTAQERLDEEEADTRFTAMLMMFYAGVASLLAALGIYSVLAYSVSRRTNEIGVRIALGARGPDVYRTVIGRALLSVLLGVILGVLGSYALTRVLGSLLYGIGSNDPVTYVLVPLGLVLVALLASWIPARRAMKVEPVTALRYE